MLDATPVNGAAIEAGRTDARAAYLDLALHSGDVYFGIDALGAIANAMGLAETARKVGMTEADLRAAFVGSTIDAVTFLRVLAAVGLDIRPIAAEPRPIAD